MIAASHPLASQAGIAALDAGGTAIDALVSAAAVLSVVEPSASGLGGDSFFLVHEAASGQVLAHNGSGRAPARLDRNRFSGHPAVPLRTPLACTTPGCVEGWSAAWTRWGKLPWKDLLAPAVHYATEGFPVSWRMGRVLRKMRAVLSNDPGLRHTYLQSDGSPLRVGDTCRPESLGATFRTLQAEGASAFYEGSIAATLAKGCQRDGGALSLDDLASHRGDFVEPYTLSLGDLTIHEQPLPSQGLLLLIMLGLVSRSSTSHPDTGWPRSTTDRPNAWRELHHQIESKKVAFALKEAFLTDPKALPVDDERVARLLTDPEVSRSLASLFEGDPIKPERAGSSVAKRLAETNGEARRLLEAYVEAGFDPYRNHDPHSSGLDTTYLCAADQDGNVAGLIQSIFHVFGSGYQEPSTGILLNNRACGFSLDPTHVNRLEPEKRTLHTLNSYLIHRDGRPWLVAGTPGGDNQVQTNLQVLRHLLHGRSLWPGPSPQQTGKWTQARRGLDTRALPFAERLAAALEAPRWRVEADGRVVVESRLPADIRKNLRKRGHDIVRIGPWEGSGLVQAIVSLPDANGAHYLGATDPRGEGVVLGL